MVRSTTTASSAPLSATTRKRPSGDTARPSGCAVPTPDTGGSEFVRALPPLVAGSTSGSLSTPVPVASSTEKMWMTSPWSPFVSASVGEDPTGRPDT